MKIHSGYIWKIVNILTFSIVSLIAKSFIDEVNIFQTYFFFKAFVAVISFLFFFKKYKRTPVILTDKLSFSRAVINLVALVLWLLSIKLLEISDATIISYTTPVFGILIGIFIFGEKATKTIYFVILLGLIGCYVIIKPNWNIYLSGFTACLASALLWAVHDSIIKAQTIKKQLIVESIFQSSFLTSLMSLPIALYFWKTLTVNELIALSMCGMLSYVNLYALGAALDKTRLSALMPISFLRIAFVTLGGYLFYHETIGMTEVTGFGFIFLANYLAIRKNALG